MMKPPSRPRSIAARLSWMNVLVSGVALLLAYVSFLAYDLVASRQAAIDNLTGEAQIIGANSVSAILFDDPAIAQSALSALSNSSDVTGATIYIRGSEPFAQYMPNGNAPIQLQPMPPGALRASWKNGIDVLVATQIVTHGKQIGVVYIQAHLANLRQQAIRYAAITGAILLLCLCVALLVGTIFRRLLSEPIVSLARTARMVSRYRDYSLRFEPTEMYDELQSLTEAFNEMLFEIQQRDDALEQARNDLELRVQERTAQLSAANRELESFSYTVAHDLRGPLEIISNITYLLQNQETGAPSDADNNSTGTMLDRLGASVAEMSNIIDDLLNLSRATSAGLHRKPLDLSALAISILEDLSTAHPERIVKTAVQLGCHANADNGLMQIALQNLLRNAWKFTSRTASARIEFGCLLNGPETVYFVRDNGAGFDQRMATRLFKPFQRLHAESDFSGTGIGLATVLRIIGRHDGEIWAEGEIGKGAVFYFTLGETIA
jgi:signal transduction histidine kinase